MGRVVAQHDDVKPLSQMVIGNWRSDGSFLHLCLPPPVSTNNISRTRAVMMNGKAIPQYYHTPKAKRYISMVKTILKSIPDQDIKDAMSKDGWIDIRMVVYPEMITLDTDNSAKLLIDCMKKDGRFMIDDAQVCAVCLDKIPREGGTARCIVTIRNHFGMEAMFPIRKYLPGLFNES